LQISKILNIGGGIIGARFKELNIPIRKNTFYKSLEAINATRIIKADTIINMLDSASIIDRYLKGEGAAKIARSLNIKEINIVRCLQKSGIVMRTVPEANKLMMSKRTKEENIKNTRKAQDAVRGKTYTHEEKCYRAICLENIGMSNVNVSAYEILVAKELTKRGIKFISQKAIDCYNVDFCIFDNIVLEIFGGGWHSSKSNSIGFSKRSKKIFDSGYTIVICWVIKDFIPSTIVDYVISLNQILCSNPTASSKHYVIGSNGKTSITGSKNLKYIT